MTDKCIFQGYEHHKSEHFYPCGIIPVSPHVNSDLGHQDIFSEVNTNEVNKLTTREMVILKNSLWRVYLGSWGFQVKTVFFFNVLSGDKKISNNWWYFHDSIIGLFLICLVSVQILRKGTLKRCLLVCERVGGVLGVVLLGDEQINDLQELEGSRKLW